jgi:tripartite-type tricarboxylate transporter receptor subunit TctC
MSFVVDRRLALGGLLGALAWPGEATAQAFPTKPIRIIVGGAAASTPDVLARLVGDRLGASIGQSVVIDNRPGAAGGIAIAGMLQSPPDGYTLALATMSQAVFNAYLMPNLPYKPLDDLMPVSNLATGPLVVAVHPSLPVNDLAGLIAHLKSKPADALLGLGSRGAPQHIAALLLQKATGLTFDIVHHSSGAATVTSAVRGDVKIIIDAPTTIAPHANAGALRALVTTGSLREPSMPLVPTVGEAGFHAATAELWIGLVAPKGTPSAVVDKINTELAAILADAKFKERLTAIGFQPAPGSSAAFASQIKDAHALWSKIILDAGLVIK